MINETKNHFSNRTLYCTNFLKFFFAKVTSAEIYIQNDLQFRQDSWFLYHNDNMSLENWNFT